MVTNLKFMFLIAAIVVTVPSVSSGFELKLTLNASNPEVTFQTPNYPGPHNAIEICTWVVSAPGNVAQLNLICLINIHWSLNCSSVSFTFFNYDEEITYCGTGNILQTLKGSTSVFKFQSTMCVNPVYMGVSCTVSYIPGDIPTCTTPVNPSCKCGEKGGQRIVGGKEATPNEYPWQALLIYKSSRTQLCGGSVIAKQWVLSASHCVKDKSPSSILVVLGGHDFEIYDSPRQDFEVIDIIMHENFEQITYGNNDIALLKLTKPIDFNQIISPICLPFNYKYYDFSDQIGIIAGWGTTNIWDNNSFSNVLREMDQKMIMYSKCTWFDGYVWFPDQITENMMCGLIMNGNTGRGDSGGPLVWKNDFSKLSFQLGVLSFGEKWDNSTEPSIYTRVSQFVDWIVAKTGAGDEFCIKI